MVRRLTTSVVTAIALTTGALAAQTQQTQEWQQGQWQLRVDSNGLTVRYRSAPVLTAAPPTGMRFGGGDVRLSVLTLRWIGGVGESVWIVGLAPNRLTLLATLPAGSDAWAWLFVNPNLLRGAHLTGNKWQGQTPFGPVMLSLSGTGLTVRWRVSVDRVVAELVSANTDRVTAQVDLVLPTQWLTVSRPTAAPSVHPVDVVQGVTWQFPLIPRPRWWRWNDEAFRLGRQVFVWALPDYRRATEALTRWLRDEWGREVIVRPWTPETVVARGIVVAPHRSPLRDIAARWEPLLRHDLLPEGYALAVTPNGVWILAADEAGAFWGVQTLRQLLRLTDDGALMVPGIFARDDPDFAFRGVHIVVDADSPDIHGRLVERVLAPLKFNHLIVQVDHLKWERHPELWQPWSLPREGAQRLLDIARANGMEVIPLVPTLSHCEYLFGALGGEKPKVNADIAEDPDSAYLYCPTNERTYRLVFDLLDEVLTLFRPTWVHIGHDEVLNRGRFGQCSRCQGTPLHQLFAADVQRLYKFLKARGIGTMMWGDMLLRPDEASDAAHGGEPHNFWLARRLLPKDIVVVDWHYQPAPQYPSVGVLRREGFTVIGATWRNFLNILGFARAARDYGAWGMVQTTWIGFGANRRALQAFPDQFAAYIRAADCFWTAGEQSVWSPAEGQAIFQALWQDTPIRALPGFVVDCSGAANVSVAQLLGLPATAVRTPPHRRWRYRLFWLPIDPHGALKAIALRSVWLNNAPSELTFEVNEAATELTFIHATGFIVPDRVVVGGYELVLDNGEKIKVPLLYGAQLRALTDTRPLRDPNAATAWRWTTSRGTITLSALTVTLPENSNLQRVKFYAADGEATPLLVAVTGVSRPPTATDTGAP
ncbi:Beta-hexosaminidase [bacterium HR17]|uniref:beta-N-acetylhexosaminidase n=1 Tax=Candidatus Fervidibacter japonicus TaxID=2035412 RepID=A0A2H5XFT0_9BACT|nr:Beta-hexosaminidase [bacterium HR17]